MNSNPTILASQFASGHATVVKDKVSVPFSIRMHRLWPWARDKEYCTPREARLVGAKNLRPDSLGLALIVDWPSHLR